MKKLILLITTGFLYCLQCHGDASLPALTITKAVQDALVRKPSVHAFAYGIKSAERQRKTTLSAYLPQISLNETFYDAKNSLNIKDSFGIQARQTVINLATYDSYKASSASVSSARHQKESHKDTIRLATEAAFLNGWVLQQKIESIVLLYNSSKEQFEKAKNQHKLNLLNKNDWLKAQAAYSQNLAIIDSYRDEVAEAEQTIEYYTGNKLLIAPSKIKSAPLTKLDWSAQQKIAVEKLSYYYKKALEHRKEIKIKQDTIDAESHTSQFYVKQYLPTVGISACAAKNTSRTGNSSWSKSASISISWNIFDGLSNYFNKTAADARKMKAILEKNDLVAQVKLEVQSAYTALQKEISAIASQNVSFTQSDNEFTLNKQQFDAGLISGVDFQTAKSIYETARFTWLSQVALTALKKQVLLNACGYGD
ncbi:TolC family protein [Candidatus Dependentiae bacterium]|nr:TolC family protein [Candidatus Dependentiae bacterium]